MIIDVIANTITTDQICLILDGPCTRQNLPGILAAFRPVSHTDDGVIRILVAITAPYGKTQIITCYKQKSESFVSDDSMAIPRRVILILMTI